MSDFSSSSYRLYKGLGKGEKRIRRGERKEKNRVVTGQEMVSRKFFKVRKKSGNFFFFESGKIDIFKKSRGHLLIWLI